MEMALNVDVRLASATNEFHASKQEGPANQSKDVDIVSGHEALLEIEEGVKLNSERENLEAANCCCCTNHVNGIKKPVFVNAGTDKCANYVRNPDTHCTPQPCHIKK